MTSKPTPPPALAARSSTGAVLARRSLEQLAAEAREAHAGAEAHAAIAVVYAICCGEALAAAKAQLLHGAWLPWLRDNFPASERLARVYMQLYANRQRVADLSSIREAVAALAERAPRPTPTGKRNGGSAVDWRPEPVGFIAGQLALPGLLGEPPAPPPADNDDPVPAELVAMWRELRAEFGDDAVTVDRLRRLAVEKLREETTGGQGA